VSQQEVFSVFQQEVPRTLRAILLNKVGAGKAFLIFGSSPHSQKRIVIPRNFNFYHY
jgi:hypothetical protein